MRNHLRSLFIFAAVFALSLPVWADHSWGSYHWARTSNPFTVELGDNVNSTWQPYLEEASDDWTQSSVLNTVIISGGTKPRTCKATNGHIEVCNATYGNNGWLGIAGIYASGNHITKSYVKLNDTYFNTSTYNTPAWRRFVTCQEIGHGFGLDHQDENFNNGNLGSCMDYTSDPDGPPSNEHPNNHDYDMLEQIYAHLDSFNTTISPAPAAMDQIDFSGPGQWGKLISQSKDGRFSVYMLDFGGGHKVFHFVIWAERQQDRDKNRQR